MDWRLSRANLWLNEALNSFGVNNKLIRFNLLRHAHATNDTEYTHRQNRAHTHVHAYMTRHDSTQIHADTYQHVMYVITHGRFVIVSSPLIFTYLFSSSVMLRYFISDCMHKRMYNVHALHICGIQWTYQRYSMQLSEK